MPTKLLLKRSTIKGKTPSSTDLQPGELAINIPDKKLFSVDLLGNVFELGGGGAKGPITLFDQAKHYVKDDLVIYGDEIYRCLQAHMGVWNATHFQPIELMPKPPVGVSQSITAAGTSDVPLTLKGAAGHSTDLFRAGIFSLGFSGIPAIRNTIPNNPALVIDPAPGQRVELVTVNSQPFIDKAGKLTPQSGAILQNPPAGTSQTITAGDPADVPLTLKGATGQTGNLQQWSDDAGEVTAAVDIYGDFYAGDPVNWATSTGQYGGSVFGITEDGTANRSEVWASLQHNDSPVLQLTQGKGKPHAVTLSVKHNVGSVAHAIQVNQVDGFTKIKRHDFVIAADGKVGIGVETPTAQLTVQTPDPKVVPLALKASTGQTGDLLQTDTDKLVVKAGGKVGIGTGNPSAQTHIKLGAAATVGLKVESATGQTADLIRAGKFSVTKDGYVGCGKTVGKALWPLTVKTDSAGGVVGRFTNDNASGITRIDLTHAASRSNRGFGLDASGNFCVWNGNAKSFFIEGTGAIHSSRTTITPIASDKRMKKVTSQLDDALDVVNQLNPIKYAWKKGYGKGEQYGFIAQEVGTVKPDALRDAEHEKLKDAKTYDPEFLVPYLVKAVQQLTAQVEELKAQLEAE